MMLEKILGGLQRDFGIYVVNLFDTFQAANILGLPKRSLDFLLALYCDLVMDKKLELTDWRKRPLSLESVRHARENTCYLLMIYYRMIRDVTKRYDAIGLLEEIWGKGQKVCLFRYTLPILNPNGHLAIFKTLKKRENIDLTFNPSQMALLKNLVSWRDDVARKEDESTGLVLPGKCLLNIAHFSPKNQSQVLNCCYGNWKIPPDYMESLIQIVNETQKSQLFVGGLFSLRVSFVSSY